MARKAQYKTKQRDELLTFLESVTGQHITAAEICDHFKTNEKYVSMTTIYRHLEKMDLMKSFPVYYTLYYTLLVFNYNKLR